MGAWRVRDEHKDYDQFSEQYNKNYQKIFIWNTIGNLKNLIRGYAPSAVSQPALSEYALSAFGARKWPAVMARYLGKQVDGFLVIQ